MRKSWRPLKYRGPPLQPPSARICHGIHGDWAHARWGNSGHPPWNTPRGGFSCWHTRAVSWAVSVAFTFLPKIEGYGGGSHPFFLYLSFSSPSSFLPSFYFFVFFFFFLLSTYIFLSLSLNHHVFTRCRAYVLKFFSFGVQVVEHTRVDRTWEGVVTVHVSKQQKTSESVVVPVIRYVARFTPIARSPNSSLSSLISSEDSRGLKDLQAISTVESFLSAQNAREGLRRIERSCTAWINQAFPLRQWNFLVTWATRVARRREGVSRVCRSQRYDDEERDTFRVGSRQWILSSTSEGSYTCRSIIRTAVSRRSLPVSIVPRPSADACIAAPILVTSRGILSGNSRPYRRFTRLWRARDS